MNLLKSSEVAVRLGVSRAAFHALRSRVPTFPQPIRVSQKVFRWDEVDINKWLEAKKESDNGEDNRPG